MRSNPAQWLFFIFQLENILRSDLNFSTSYGPLTDLKSLSLGLTFIIRVIISEFYMAWRKNFTKNLLIGGGRLSPPCPDDVHIAYVQSG